MIKSIAYLLLLILGLGATLGSSLWGGVTVILAYMFNPITFARELPLQRYQFYAALAFLLSVMMHPRSRLQSIKPDHLVFRFLWLYVAVCLLSCLWADRMEWSFEHSFNFSKTVLIAWLFTKIVHDERGIRILMIAGMIGAVHAAFMHTFGVDFDWVSKKKYGDEYGVLPDMQAPVMLLFLPLLLTTAIMGRTIAERGFAWLGLPIVLNSIVESYQRAYFVGLLAEAACLMLFLPKRIALRLAPALGAAFILYVFVLTPADYWSWMDTIENPTGEGSANSRFMLYEGSSKMLADYPMGVGYRMYIFHAHKYLQAGTAALSEEGATKGAHSSVCAVACETGVLGFALWMAAIGSGLWLMRRIRKASDTQNPSQFDVYAMSMEIGIYGWFAGGLFHSDHEIDVAYWFLAFAVILHRLRFSPGPVRDPRDLSPDLVPIRKPLGGLSGEH